MRCFIALTLPDAHRNALTMIQSFLAHHLPSVKWVPTQQIHLTLRFFANLSGEDAERVKEALRTATTGTPAGFVRLCGIGAFPDVRRPRVIWVGLEDPDAYLRQLYDRLSVSLDQQGLPPEDRPFHPHVTLGRVRNPTRLHTGSNPIREAVIPEAAAVPFPVSELILFQSVLSSQGPAYTELFTARLRPCS
jgi:2'-5' RNA ligase